MLPSHSCSGHLHPLAVTIITKPMSPQSRTARLTELLEKYLEIDLAEFGRMAKLLNEQVKRLRKGTYKWNSSAVNESIAKGLGMTRDQLFEFLDGAMSYPAAMKVAETAIARGRKMLAEKASIAKVVNSARVQLEREMGKPTVEGLASHAIDIAWDAGWVPPTKQQATRVLMHLQDALSRVHDDAKRKFSGKRSA
jgi:hypothetical protein